jgi:hypothetical protein
MSLMSSINQSLTHKKEEFSNTLRKESLEDDEA